MCFLTGTLLSKKNQQCDLLRLPLFSFFRGRVDDGRNVLVNKPAGCVFDCGAKNKVNELIFYMDNSFYRHNISSLVCNVLF